MSHRYLAGIAFAIVFASVPAASRGPFQQSTPDITGLWGSETTFGPQVRGDLTLERRGESWTLRIGGFEVAAPAGGDSLRLALPGGQGELRAWLDAGGSDIRAYWVQPAGNLVPYATPVALERARAGVWRGIVEPLDERFSLYLHVAAAAGRHAERRVSQSRDELERPRAVVPGRRGGRHRGAGRPLERQEAVRAALRRRPPPDQHGFRRACGAQPARARSGDWLLSPHARFLQLHLSGTSSQPTTDGSPRAPPMRAWTSRGSSPPSRRS